MRFDPPQMARFRRHCFIVPGNAEIGNLEYWEELFRFAATYRELASTSKIIISLNACSRSSALPLRGAIEDVGAGESSDEAGIYQRGFAQILVYQQGR
jgi:hypothetical protein